MNEPVRLDAVGIGRTLDDIAEIGNRYAGSPGEATCRDYLVDRFAALGLDEVRLEPFAYLGYEPLESACTVLGIGARELECHPLQYTANAEVEGEAVYLGDAAEADFARLDRRGVDLAGRVVVVHSMFPFDLVDVLAERGIAGLVHVCETPDGIVGNFTGALFPPPLEAPWAGRPTPYPGVTIGHGTGRELISTLTTDAPVTLRLVHRARYAQRTADNVVGAIRGTGHGDVVLCAHYDSQFEGPCVFDNGTGVGSLLEAARALRSSAPSRRIVVLASAAEEIGCWGASAYVHAHSAELDGVAGMVNLDGVASAYPAQREIWSVDAGMLGLAVEVGQGLGWRPDRVMNQRSTFADHAAFADAGVPACLIWRPDYPYYHSRGDVRGLVDEVAVAETASVSATLASRLASGVPVPREAVPAR